MPANTSAHVMQLLDDKNRKWWILVAMGGVVGLILLDETVVGVALPSVKRDLGLSEVAAHWVINAYLLVFAGLAAAAGKLGDVVGLKRLFILGVVIFGLASLSAGFAQDGFWAAVLVWSALMTFDFVCNDRRLRRLDEVIVRCSAPFVGRVMFQNCIES